MHNSHQSFAARQRMLNHDGDASNQVIWFTDARPARAFDQTPEAFEVIDEWMANIRAHPERGVAGNKPAARGRPLLHHDGDEIAARRRTCGTASSTTAPPAPAPQRFPIYSTSRIVGGRADPRRRLQVRAAAGRRRDRARALRRGQPDRGQRARLEQIFPDGVCDYRQADVGRP